MANIRVFKYEGKEYPDPDPALSVEEVRQALANIFPELSNAETKKHEVDGKDVYTFEKKVGTKG